MSIFVFFFVWNCFFTKSLNDIPIITYLNGAYNEILKNFICNLRLLSIETNLHVYIADKSLAPFLEYENISYTYIVSGKNAELLSTYGTSDYWNIARKKILAFLDASYKFKYFIFTDVDILWLRNPIKFLKQCKYNICFQPNHDIHKNNINSGFFYAKSTFFTKSFFRKALLLTKDKKFEFKGSQAIIDFLLTRKFKHRKYIKVLDHDMYPHGGQKNYWNNTLSALIKHYPKMQVLHNNWISGRDSKINRFKRTNSWFLKNGKCNQKGFSIFFPKNKTFLG